MNSLSRYKLIDLSLFTFLICASEALNIFMVKKVFTNQLFTLSVALTLSMVVVVRWGFWGAFPAVLAGLVTALFNSGSSYHYLVYGAGALGVLSGVVFLKIVGHKKVQSSWLWMLLYLVCGFLAVNILRSLLALTINFNFIQNFIQYMASDSLNLVIGFILLLIIKRQDGIFERQLDYLYRIQEQKDRQNMNFGGEV